MHLEGLPCARSHGCCMVTTAFVPSAACEGVAPFHCHFTNEEIKAKSGDMTYPMSQHEQ
jgi:hypothetical protein